MNQKSTLAVALALVGGVAVSLANPWNPKPFSKDPMPIISSQKARESRADMETRKSNLHMNVAGIKHVKINVELAEVSVSTNSSSNFDAQITKSLNRPINDKERQWLDNPWLKSKLDGDTLIVYEDKSLKPELHYNEKSSKKNVNLEFTLNIEIPSGLDVEVSVTAGDVKIGGDYRSLSSHIDAGQLKLDRFQATDSLKINLDAGQVDAVLAQMPRNQSQIEVAVGEVNLDIRGNATVDARTSIGSISHSADSKAKQKGIGSKQKLQFGTGGSNLTVEVEAGSINFGSAKVSKVELQDSSDELDELEIPDVDIQADLDDELGAKFKKIMFIDRDVTNALKAAQRELDSQDIKGEIEKAFKEAKKEMQSHDVQAEIAKAMKEVERTLNSKDFQRDIEKAMKDAEIHLNNKDIAREIEKAMKTAEVEMKRSGRDSDKEIAQAIKEIDQAIKELDLELKQNRESNGGFQNLTRDALVIAKRALERAKVAAQQAKAHKN